MNGSSVFVPRVPRASPRMSGPYTTMNHAPSMRSHSNVHRGNVSRFPSMVPKVPRQAMGNDSISKDPNFTPFRPSQKRSGFSQNGTRTGSSGSAKVERSEKPNSEIPKRPNTVKTPLSKKVNDLPKAKKTEAPKKAEPRSKSESAKPTEMNEKEVSSDPKPQSVESFITNDSKISTYSPFLMLYILLCTILLGIICIVVFVYIAHDQTRGIVKEFMKKNLCLSDGVLDKILHE